jgi:hypothetical protein
MVNYPTNIQTGYLFDENGKKFDISVILNFPTNESYNDPNSTDDDLSVNLIDFYFGTPNDLDTETFVKQFIEKQIKLRVLLDRLSVWKLLYSDNTELTTEIDEQIDFVKSLIVKIH